MSNILPGSKPQVDPKLEDLAFVTQDNKPRNSTLQKIKNLFLGTTNMGTTATTVTGAVAEVNSQLNEIMNNPRAQYSFDTEVTTTNNSWKIINWNKKIFDTNEFIHQSDNSVITIKESGLYIVNVAICFNFDSATGTRNIKITKNNNEVIGYDSRNAWTMNNTRCNLSIIQYLNANETITISAYQDSGTDINLKVDIPAFPLLSIAKIGGKE